MQANEKSLRQYSMDGVHLVNYGPIYSKIDNKAIVTTASLMIINQIQSGYKEKKKRKKKRQKKKKKTRKKKMKKKRAKKKKKRQRRRKRREDEEEK